jgi:hypothetical protein
MHLRPRALPPGAHHCLVSKEAINILTLQEQASFSTVHNPRTLMKQAKMPIHFEHFASQMVHPVTGHTISGYKKLMNNLATALVCDLSSLLGIKFWTRLLGSWKQVSKSRYILIRKLWEIKVWFLYLKESSNKWWYICVVCRPLHHPVVFDTCHWWTHVPSVLCGCARRRVYVRGSLVIGLVWVPIQVLLRTRWYLSTL